MNIILLILYFLIVLFGRHTGVLPFFFYYMFNLYCLTPEGIIITLAIVILIFTKFYYRNLVLHYFLRTICVFLLWIGFVYFLYGNVEGYNSGSFSNPISIMTISIFLLFSFYYVYWCLRKWAKLKVTKM